LSGYEAEMKAFQRSEREMIKATKAEAEYTGKGTEREHCGICTYYNPQGTCRRIEGRVSPDGWCEFFHRSATIRKADKPSTERRTGRNK
jgi:hypothetical protein